MKRLTPQKHSIDVLFQLVVFLLFTFSAIVLLLLGVNFYRSTVERSDKNNSARVAVAYIREVVHQNDEADCVSLTEFDGLPCMKLKQAEGYVLYLYLLDGELRELYTKEDAKVSSADGQKIMELESLSFTMQGPATLLVECEDLLGNKEQVFISIRSKTEGGAL